MPVYGRYGVSSRVRRSWRYTMAMDYLADGFRTIDAQRDIAKFAACLTFLDSLPSFSVYKSYLCDVAVRSGGPSLDVACGLGYDVLRVAQKLPQYTAFGIDLSDKFLNAARTQAEVLGAANVKFQRMDARNLEFPDETFASTRVD